MKYILLLLPCFLVFGAAAQSPYQFSKKGEIAWVGSGAVGLGFSKILGKYNKPLNAAQIAGLDAGQVPRFDRYSLNHFSASARHGSDALLYGSPIISLLLVLDPKIRRETPKYALLNVESALSAAALTTIVKRLARRTRPLAYNPEVPLALKMEQDARASFFSGHTSVTAALSFSTAKIWQDHHRGSRWSPLVWAGAVAVPVATGFLRMKAGKHFPSDVATGLVIGAFCGWVVPELHRLR